MTPAETWARRVAAFYEALTPASLDQLPGLYTPDARFRDPFNDVTGIEAIGAIFRHLYAVAEQPAFRVSTTLAADREALLAWEFTLRVRGRPISICGTTHLRFDADGRVCDHTDYWDPTQLYRHLPLIGALARRLAQAFAAPLRPPDGSSASTR